MLDAAVFCFLIQTKFGRGEENAIFAVKRASVSAHGKILEKNQIKSFTKTVF